MTATVTASAQTNDSISMDTTLWYNQTQQLGEVVVKSRLPRTKLKGNSKYWAKAHPSSISMAARCTTRTN